MLRLGSFGNLDALNIYMCMKRKGMDVTIMAKPGPRPQPTAKKKLHGNPGRRPLPENEPEPRMEDGIPGAPDHLDALGKKEWDRMAAELYPIGVMTVVDRTALEAYCSEYSKWVFATKKSVCCVGQTSGIFY